MSADLTSDGKLFQARGAAMQKVLKAETETTSGNEQVIIVGLAQGDLAVESGDGLDYKDYNTRIITQVP